MVKPICLQEPNQESRSCTDQSLPPSLLLRSSNPSGDTQETARNLQENLSRLATAAGLPYQLSYGINAMRWGNLQYHTDSAHANAETTLIVPLVVEGAPVSGTLDQVVTYKATINEDGSLEWDVVIGFQGTSELDAVAALLDSAGGMIDQTYFRNLIEAAHVDFALLAPALWARGEASPLAQNSVLTTEKPGEGLGRYSQDPEVIFGAGRQTTTAARGLMNLLSLALSGDNLPPEGPARTLFLTRAASILYRIPIRNDSGWHDVLFWQHFTYGEVIYLEQLFSQAMKRFHIDPSSPLGKLYQRNIDHLRTVHRHMHYDDDFMDEDFDPELRGTALAMQKVHGGPTPPDYTYDPGWIEEKIFDVVESGSGRKMGKFDFKPGWLEERAAELTARTIDRATDKVIERTVPKIKAAIDEVIPKLDELKGKLIAYAADSRNRKQIADAIQQIASDLKPVIKRFLSEVGKMSEAELKKRLPRLKAQLRELADLIEKEIYPKQIKPIVTELVEALSEIGRGNGSEVPPAGEAGPPSGKGRVTDAPAPGVPRSVGEWDKPR